MKNSKRAFKTRPNRKRLNILGLEKRLGCSRQTIWRLYTEGDLPKPHYLGQPRLWFEDEIEEWEQKEMSSRASIKEAYRNASDEQIAQPSSADTFYKMSGSSPPVATSNEEGGRHDK